GFTEPTCCQTPSPSLTVASPSRSRCPRGTPTTSRSCRRRSSNEMTSQRTEIARLSALLLVLGLTPSCRQADAAPSAAGGGVAEARRVAVMRLEVLLAVARVAALLPVGRVLGASAQGLMARI